jgi:hypothetical protein
MKINLSVLAILFVLFFDANASYIYNANANYDTVVCEEDKIEAHVIEINKDTSSIIKSINFNENISYVDSSEMIKDFASNWSNYKRSIGNSHSPKCLVR